MDELTERIIIGLLVLIFAAVYILIAGMPKEEVPLPATQVVNGYTIKHVMPEVVTISCKEPGYPDAAVKKLEQDYKVTKVLPGSYNKEWLVTFEPK